MLAPFSLTPALDTNGRFIRTAVLAIYEAGTTTPAVLYRQADYAAGTEHPNPIPLTGSGLLPAMYGAGSFKFRLLTGPLPGGSIVWEADGVTLTDPPKQDEGTGENTGLLQTGQIAQFYSTGSRPGFVRGNGRTIGNAASGATERAALDTLALYLLLWSEDDSLVVSGGRGSTAQADFEAGKALALPDFRARGLISVDGMGAAASGRFAGLGWSSGGSATRLGSYTGGWTTALTVGQLPSHDHPSNFAIAAGGAFSFDGTTANQNIDHIHAIGVVNYQVNVGTGFSFLAVYAGPASAAPASQATSNNNPIHQHAFNVSQPAHGHALSGAVQARGSGESFGIANPILLVTTYLKL